MWIGETRAEFLISATRLLRGPSSGDLRSCLVTIRAHQISKYLLIYNERAAASKIAFDRCARTGTTQLTGPVRIPRLDPKSELRRPPPYCGRDAFGGDHFTELRPEFRLGRVKRADDVEPHARPKLGMQNACDWLVEKKPSIGVNSKGIPLIRV